MKQSSNFRKYWEVVSKSKGGDLSPRDLVKIQQTIAQLQKRKYPAQKIIKYLQDHNSKLVEKWKAERAFWTELKNLDTQKVRELSEDLGITRYKAILSPDACPICREKTRMGTKVFDNQEMTKGAGEVPPFHPNCYCIMVPVS